MDASRFLKYPDAEARTPRDRFTATLRKICERLDERSSAALSFKHWYLDEQLESNTEIVAVWVVGSYARGALTCGDLDLVVEFRVTAGSHAPFNLVKKTFIGSAAGVRAYEGTPTRNSSGATFTEAIQVWAPGFDWAAALDAIAVDPAAGRFARQDDDIPLRVEQHRLPFSARETLIQLHSEQVLTWRFIPLSELTEHADFKPRTADEQRAFEQFSEGSAAKMQAASLVFGAARALASKNGCVEAVSHSWVRKNVVRVGTFELHFERLDLGVLPLHKASCSAVAFLPALSTRGPNGIWLIERGPKHELVEAFADTAVWVLAEPDGAPQQIEFLTSVDERQVSASGTELFATEADARACEQTWREASNDPDDYLVPRLLKGAEVADLLGGLDVVMFYGTDTLVVLTSRGRRYAQAAERHDALELSALKLGKRLPELFKPEPLAA